MTRKFFFIFTLSILFISCSKSKTVYFKTKDAKGLEIGDYVMLDSLNIGEVTDFGLAKNGNVIITSEITSDFFIPYNSKFKNTQYSKEGQRCISVVLGGSDIPLKENDTLQLRNSYDRIINKGKEKLLDKIKEKLNKNQ